MSDRITTVTVDDEYHYPATVDDTVNWNGWLCPRFDLATVRQIAADSDQPDNTDTVHVFDRTPCEWTDHQPGALVALLSWGAIVETPDQSPFEVITPGADGLYPVGSFAWAWHESTPDTDLAV